jgi:dolichol kinase
LAVLATALEQWSVFGIDNLSVPVLTGMLWSQWSG